MIVLPIALMIGCTPAEEPTNELPEPVVSVDTDEDDSTEVIDLPDTNDDDDDPGGLGGEVLDPPIAPPTFLVENHLEEARDDAWLTGAPTVLWFYRDAAEAG